MSAQEIIEQIKALPREQQLEISEYIRTIDARPARSRPISNAEFDQIIDDIFVEHDELLRKLAQ